MSRSCVILLLWSVACASPSTSAPAPSEAAGQGAPTPSSSAQPRPDSPATGRDEPPAEPVATPAVVSTEPAPTIALEGEARAYRAGREFRIDATVAFTNEGLRPLRPDPDHLRLRDQAGPLRVLSHGTMPRSELAPGGRQLLRVTAVVDHPARESTVLRVDYGVAGAMGPVVSAPVRLYPTSGLRAHFEATGPAERRVLAAVGRRPTRFGYRVTLRMRVTNPTDHLVRRPSVGVTATREGGTSSYWGDHAQVRSDLDWFEPGASATGTVVLMFPAGPRPPRALRLRYDDGPVQTLRLPAAATSPF